jgi:putative aldouronate transport system substrate-binding protein
MPEINRRALLRSIGAVTAVTAASSVLTACGTSGASGGATNKGHKLAPWPSYIARTGPAPDLKGDPATGVQDAYLAYPQKLTKGTSEAPGDGSTITFATLTYGTALKPRDKNKYWQAVEKALGVKIDFTAIPAADYPDKMATIMAGGDLPDVLSVAPTTALPHEGDFIVKTMANLSEFLSGDAVKDYPNLANIATSSWKSVGRFDGGIYGVPIPRAKPGPVVWIDEGEFAKRGYETDGAGFSRDRYTGVIRDLTHGKQYGLGATTDLGWSGHAGSHGVPNSWSLSNGKFISQYESPHFEEMLSYLNKLWTSRLYYPDSLSLSSVDIKTRFYNGTVKSYVDSFSALPATLSTVRDFAPQAMIPYTVDGVTPTHRATFGRFGYTVINKKLSPAKIKMVLRVLDYLSSPFGTEEYQLVNYGVEGVHFTRNDKGDPIPTELGSTENVVNLPFYYMGSAPQVLYVPNAAEGVKAAYKWEQQICPKMVDDPSAGLRSDTESTSGTILDQNVNDTMISIITGRQPISSWGEAVKKWKSGGGDQIAKEYASEYAAGTTK